MAQIARPASDVAAGGWGTTGTWLYEVIDEVSANDVDHIFWDGASGPDPAIVGLAAVADPLSSSSHQVVFRAWVGNGGSSADLTVTLLQGTTVIASTLVGISSVPSNYAATLSGAQADAITDYAALRLRFLAANLDSGDVRVSHAYLTVPDAPPVALQATGNGTSSGTAALDVRRGFAGSGTGTSSGTAALDVRRGLTGSGSGAATGSADLTVRTDAIVPLAASGTGSAGGTAALDVRRGLAGSGTGTSSGTAALDVRRGLAATGTGGSSGAASLEVAAAGAADARVVVGPDARVATPASALSPLIRLAASGVGAATGSAGLTVTREVVVLAASGAGGATGSAALGVVLALAAWGSGAATGSAALTVTREVVVLAASGAGGATGSAALGVVLALAAWGSGAATGSAALTVTAAGFVSLAAAGTGGATGQAALDVRRGLTGSGGGVATGSAILTVRDALQVPSTRGYPHVTLWSDYPWRAGVPVRRLAALIDWEERHAVEEFLVTHQCTARLPTTWEGTALLAPAGIIQVVRRPGDVRWYEIQDVSDGLGDGGITAVTALGAEYGLATVGQVPSTSAVTTVGAAIGHVLAACPAGYTVGAVTPSTVLIQPDETAFAGASPGAALRMIAEAVRARTGVTYEVSLTPTGADGRTGFAVNLTQLGQDLAAIDLPFGTALTGLRRIRTLRSQLTRAHDPAAGLGDLGGTGPEASWWLVTAVDAGANTIDVTALGGGPGPAVEAGQWGGSAYTVRPPPGVLQDPVTTTVLTAETTRLTLTSTTGISVHSRVPLLLAAGTPPVDVRLPSIEALGGRPILRPTPSGVGRTSNLSRNPALALWSGGTPVGLGANNVTRSLVPGTWETGGSSAEFGVWGMGGSLNETLTIHVPVATTLTYVIRYLIAAGYPGATWFSWLDPESGAHKYELGGPTWDAGAGTMGTPTGPLRPRGVWQSWSQSVRCPAGISTLQCQIGNAAMVNIGGIDTVVQESVFVDAIGTLVGGTGWLAGSGPARAIHHANRHLQAHGGDQVSYEITPLNLARLDPAGAGKYRTLRLGASATIIGRGLGIRDTVRMLEHVEPGRGLGDRLTLATRSARLTRALAGSG